MFSFLSLLSMCLAGAMAADMMGSKTISAQPVKVTTTTPSGQKIEVVVDVTIISWSPGGDATMNQVSPPPMAPGKTHEVQVGGTNLIYNPSSISAALGDIVRFTFLTTNHTLTQSTFDKPCVRLPAGLDSTFLANPNNTVSPPPTFTMQVNTLAPMWFYCRQKAHCGKGMVFSVNPTAEKSQAKFVELAMQQNGTGVGGPSSASATATASVSVSVSPVVIAVPPLSSSSSSSSSSSEVVSGTGSREGEGGACACSCLCGTQAFPPMMGVGNFGGMPGMKAMS